jgi:hypothetical protein
MTSVLPRKGNELRDGVIRPVQHRGGGSKWVHLGNPGRGLSEPDGTAYATGRSKALTLNSVELCLLSKLFSLTEAGALA